MLQPSQCPNHIHKITPDQRSRLSNSCCETNHSRIERRQVRRLLTPPIAKLPYLHSLGACSLGYELQLGLRSQFAFCGVKFDASFMDKMISSSMELHQAVRIRWFLLRRPISTA